MFRHVLGGSSKADEITTPAVSITAVDNHNYDIVERSSVISPKDSEFEVKQIDKKEIDRFYNKTTQCFKNQLRLAKIIENIISNIDSIDLQIRDYVAFSEIILSSKNPPIDEDFVRKYRELLTALFSNLREKCQALELALL